MALGRVLSIQSHVVHGCVGNKASTFPLQLLGFEVDPLNTVQFSNHTRYPLFRGDRLHGDQLQMVLEGLRLNGILKTYTHVLTGYVGQLSSLEAIVGIIQEIRKEGSGVTVCENVIDPVMGDDHRMYVPSELLPVYRDKLLRLADITTPNGFEAELLTGMTIDSVESARQALVQIHALGPRVVVITSVELADDSSHIHLFASLNADGNQPQQIQVVIPRRTGSFTGTGDLFSALLLAHIGDVRQIGIDGLVRGCEAAVSAMQSVLAETERAVAAAGPPQSAADAMRQRELQIVASRNLILNASETISDRIVATKL